MLACPSCNRLYPDGATTCTHDGSALGAAPSLPSRDATLSDALPPSSSEQKTVSTVELVGPPSSLLGTDLRPGTMVGEYRVESRLGKGGFGTVYKAVHPVIHKAVAIKVLHPRLAANQEAVSRFVAEARAVNRIRHRNIVDIFSFGRLDDGRSYFVMDLLEGSTLRALIQNGRIPPTEAIGILRPLARALDAAHAAGIAHRDLKPDNIFLAREPDGHVIPKLIDFGLAKLLDPQSGATNPNLSGGFPVGTPKYMSPEQCRGGQVDHRTDIYSLGIVVYELLTGQRPFESRAAVDILIQHRTENPRRPSEICSDLPVSLDAPLLHMLEKEPDHRPSTASEAIEALARVLRQSAAPQADRESEVPLQVRFASSPAGSARSLEVPTPSGATLSSSGEMPSRRSKFVVGLAIVAATLAGVAGVFAVSHRPEATSAASSAAPSDPTPSREPAPVEPAREVTLEIHSTPAVVDVYLDDTKLGTSQEPIHLPRSDTRMKLTFTAPGHAPSEIEITPSANNVLTVALAKPSPAPPKRAPKRMPAELESPYPQR